MKRQFFGLFILFSLLSGCFLFSKEPLVVARDLAAQGRKEEAIQYALQRLNSETDTKAALEMARFGAHLAHIELRDYESATRFYRHIANYSQDTDEQLSTLRYLGTIYFDHLKDYELAISIFETILRYPLSKEEKARYRLLLGKSHYNLAQLDQAEAELAAFKGLNPPNSIAYDGQVFESNILVSKKQHEAAAKILKTLIEKNPERAQSDGLEMNLVACYEDMKDFDAAIEAMESMRKTYPDPEFLDMRIGRLKERKNNMPGARGLHK